MTHQDWVGDILVTHLSKDSLPGFNHLLLGKPDKVSIGEALYTHLAQPGCPASQCLRASQLVRYEY